MTTELSKTELGDLGESLVAGWLQSQGWHLQTRQWHCTYGELDLVVSKGAANASGTLAFVEVKTRSSGNWDAYGLMSITRSKQAKLWKSARIYLLKHPQWTDATCRFDVALVACHPGQSPAPSKARENPAGERPEVPGAAGLHRFSLRCSGALKGKDL